MANLKFNDRQIIEHVLGMRGGYVLDLSNSDFDHLIFDATGIDVYAKAYEAKGTSKANRLRLLIERESSHLVAKALEALLEREARFPETYRTPPVTDRDRADCQVVLSKLRTATDINNLPMLNVGNAHATFAHVRDEVSRYIGEGRFDSGVDRLHTFVTQYLRLLIQKRSGNVPSDIVPLHSLLGSYVKGLQEQKKPTEMSLRILKSAISILEAFNAIRNDKSLAHPNESVIDRNEARLIFAYVIALVGYVEELEREVAPAIGEDDDGIPF